MKDILAPADACAAKGDEVTMYAILRSLPVEDFVHCIFYPPAQYSSLFARLPRLPSAEIQRNFVGNDGSTLEQMTAAFVRNLTGQVARRFPGGIPYDGKVLDYGCGWGRILRMMPYLVVPASLFAVDPMPQSLELCRELNVVGDIKHCDSIPSSIPFAGTQFDLVYAFSVFTHLSEEAARAVLRAIRARTLQRGMLVITVRPVEFWEIVQARYGPRLTAQLAGEHMANRYAFVGGGEFIVDGRPTYGEASMSLALLTDIARDCGWATNPTHDRSLVDPFQLVYCLYPA